MKIKPHSYMLSLSKTEKAVIALGIKTAISKGKFSPDAPDLMSKALSILSRVENPYLIITAWDAEYIIVPSLNTVPVGALEDGLYSGMCKIAKHEI